MPAPNPCGSSGEEITGTRLVQAAAQAGFAVDRQDLKALRKAGLLQPCRQVHVSGVAGSETLYPTAARDQLVLVLRLQQNERRFDRLRVLAWWGGGWVEPTLLRASICEALDRAGLTEVRRLLKTHPDPIDAADHLLDSLKTARSRNPVIRRLQRNLGDREGRWEVAVHLLIQIALAGEPIWHVQDVGFDDEDEAEPDPTEQLQLAGGLTHARTETITLDGQPLGPLLPIQTPLPQIVKRFTDAGFFPVTAWPELVDGATARELNLARDDTQDFIEPLVAIVAALEALGARGGLGLSLLPRLRRATHDAFPVLWVPYWIAWRRTATSHEKRALRYLGVAVRLAAPAAHALLAQIDTRQSDGGEAGPERVEPVE